MMETRAKRIRPSRSYEVTLPQEIQEKHDSSVSSYWINQEPLLLQFSSYFREHGPQITAEERLRERVAKTSRKWTVWNRPLSQDPQVDQAVAEFIDECGLLWIHAYLVWPHLTVYATISGPPKIVGSPDNWALSSLKTLRPLLQ
jgi:hypothetical protein